MWRRVTLTSGTADVVTWDTFIYVFRSINARNKGNCKRVYNKYSVYEEVLGTYVEEWDTDGDKSSPNDYRYIFPQLSHCLLIIYITYNGFTYNHHYDYSEQHLSYTYT